MANVILRRRGLGNGSCKGIVEKCKQEFSIVRNDKVMPPEIEWGIRWGCTSKLPAKNVLNKVDAIQTVNNKLQFRKVLSDEGLCPLTYLSPYDYLDHHDVLNTPAVVRRSVHHQGKYLHVSRTEVELERDCLRYGVGNYYISPLIDKVSEYRVFIVQGRVACVAQKTPGNPDEVAWNVAKGGRFDNVRWDGWDLNVCENAIKSFNLSGLDFGGVDVMVDRGGRSYTLEINSAPSLTSEYRKTCMAKCFDYIVENNKEVLNVGHYRNYRGIIHPAISNKAEGI